MNHPDQLRLAKLFVGDLQKLARHALDAGCSPDEVTGLLFTSAAVVTSPLVGRQATVGAAIRTAMESLEEHQLDRTMEIITGKPRA